MLITVSFPIVDYREILKQETAKIDLQSIGKNWNQELFLRSSGRIAQRKRGGPLIPYNEYHYADASKAIRVTLDKSMRQKEKRLPQVAFQRVFFNHYCIRLDIGIHAFPYGEKDWLVYQKWIYVRDYIRQSLAQIRSNKSKELISIGQDFAQHYLAATSKHGILEKIDSKWVAAGCPVVVAECEMSDASKRELQEGEITFTQKSMYRANVIPSDWEDIELIYTTYGNNVPVWLILKGDHARKDCVRALRIFLLKWHQEREAFQYISGFLSQKNTDKRNVEVERVAEILDDILKDLLKKKRNGILQEQLWTIVNKANEFVIPNQGKRMLDYVKKHKETCHLENRLKYAINLQSKEKMMKEKIVFISYTWEDEAYNKWVGKFSQKLSQDGICTIIDQKDIKYGERLTNFMEKIASCDYVLFLCTPTYKNKADNRATLPCGGAYENNLMTGELLQKMNDEKFIPVLTKGSWEESTPNWAIGKKGVDLRDGKLSGSQYKQLVSYLKNC